MLQYEYLLYTPAFYFLVAFTLLLTFGYLVGRRQNRRIVMSALDPLLEVFKAKDHQFTNIGGQTGYQHYRRHPPAARGAHTSPARDHRMRSITPRETRRRLRCRNSRGTGRYRRAPTRSQTPCHRLPELP
ncbi:MAG: hypothetical protein ACOC2V_04570 [Alkalispirochaeta sp.]